MQIACSPHGLLAQGSVGFSDVLAIKGQTSVWLRLLRLKCNTKKILVKNGYYGK